MPDIYTHILCGRKTIENMNGYIAECINGKLNTFFLGCMGPDIFFYNRFNINHRYKVTQKLGSIMHRQHCGELISESFRYIKATAASDAIDERTVYMFGYLCHYALDRAAHPYIYSRSGIYNRNDKSSRRFMGAHKVMELAIDYHMARRFDNIDINSARMYEYIDIGAVVPSDIQELYIHLFNKYFKNIFNMIDGSIVNDAYLGIKKAWKMLYDPKFIKRKLLKITMLNIFFYPIDPNARDYMNYKKESWTEPCSCQLRDQSFLELFEISIRMASGFINSALKYLNGDICFEELKGLIGNFSFLTNRNIDTECQKMECFSPIF